MTDNLVFRSFILILFKESFCTRKSNLVNVFIYFLFRHINFNSSDIIYNISHYIKINTDGTSRRYYAIPAKMFKNSVIPAIPAGQEEDNDV